MQTAMTQNSTNKQQTCWICTKKKMKTTTTGMTKMNGMKKMNGRNNMKEIFKKFEESEKKTDEIERKWEEDPENEELNKSWYESYKEEREALDNLITRLMEVLPGTNVQTIRKMIFTKREELREIINKM